MTDLELTQCYQTFLYTKKWCILKLYMFSYMTKSVAHPRTHPHTQACSELLFPSCIFKLHISSNQTKVLWYFSLPLLTNVVFVFSQRDRKWWRQHVSFKAETLSERGSTWKQTKDMTARCYECSLSNLCVQFAKRYGHLKNFHLSCSATAD